jgi:hypothetical protein
LRTTQRNYKQLYSVPRAVDLDNRNHKKMVEVQRLRSMERLITKGILYCVRMDRKGEDGRYREVTCLPSVTAQSILSLELTYSLPLLSACRIRIQPDLFSLRIQ